MTTITKTRGILYRLARGLGWLRAAEDVAEGRPDKAAMTVAKRFPRNQKQAYDRIMLACQRPSLAEEALYSYSRGGTEITGPSIRLAEDIGQIKLAIGLLRGGRDE